MRQIVLATLLGLALHVPRVDAQVVVIDEGTFSLLVRGARVGREDFSIRRSPPSAEAAYVAQANISSGDGRVGVAMNTDSLGTPLRFKHETLVAGAVQTSVSGEWRGGLWSGRSVQPLGESAREFRLPTPSIAAEPGVIHHLWFLIRFAPRGRTITQLLPRTLAVRSIRVDAAGTEPFAIGLSEFQARRWIVRSVPAGTVLNEVWTDSLGRLLRVRIPAEELEAVRDEAPGETLRGLQAYAPLSVPFSPIPGWPRDATSSVPAVPARPGAAAWRAIGAPHPVAQRRVGDRHEEQPGLPAVRHGTDTGGRGGARGVRRAPAER
jgi:hypothetical protein